ncbi:MAG: small acid-soluble spore protein H [Bacillota bacterium]
MDIKRAKKIAASPVMANVTYNGNRIYIENVDETRGTASIHPLNQPENRQEVPVNNLLEQ